MIILLAILWIGWAFLCRRLVRNPRGDFEAGVVMSVLGWYARRRHHVTYEGLEHLPDDPDAGPLIVISNHTAGVDPILIQVACPFEVRWMMARDMMISHLQPFWNWARIIPVEKNGTGPRTAIRHLAAGGVVGIFPEGGIERPPCQIRPFHAGVGLIVARSRARVIPVIIDGTPQVDPAWASLWTPSHARVRFMPPLDYRGRRASDIVEDLRARFIEWTGWPANDTPETREDDALDAA